MRATRRETEPLRRPTGYRNQLGIWDSSDGVAKWPGEYARTVRRRRPQTACFDCRGRKNCGIDADGVLGIKPCSRPKTNTWAASYSPRRTDRKEQMYCFHWLALRRRPAECHWGLVVTRAPASCCRASSQTQNRWKPTNWSARHESGDRFTNGLGWRRRRYRRLRLPHQVAVGWRDERIWKLPPGPFSAMPTILPRSPEQFACACCFPLLYGSRTGGGGGGVGLRLNLAS